MGQSDKSIKAISVEGNVNPSQRGPIDYRSVATAISKGIVVNTIHCGPEAEGIAGQWEGRRGY